MILFHSGRKLAAGAGIAPAFAPSKGAVLRLDDPAIELVEPEVVATSPFRIKSPVPVCCGFSSKKRNGARGRICTCTADALDVVPLLVGLRERQR